MICKFCSLTGVVSLWVGCNLKTLKSCQLRTQNESRSKSQILFIVDCPLSYSLSHRGQPQCDQRDPRERPAHLLWLHPGRYSFGCRQRTDVQADPNRVLLLPAASNHPRHRLLHAKQALLWQLGWHPGLRCSGDMLECCHLGTVAVGVLQGRSHG